MSAEKLKMIDAMAQKYIQDEKFPGGVILVARRGVIVYYKSFGYRTPEKKELYKNSDIFRIASMSKAITTVGIMQLYERGTARPGRSGLINIFRLSGRLRYSITLTLQTQRIQR